MEIGNAGKSDDGGNRVGNRLDCLAWNPLKRGDNHLRECRFTDPSKRKAGHRYPKLGGGEEPVGVLHDALDDTRTPIPLADELFDAGPPQGYERELGSDEKPLASTRKRTASSFRTIVINELSICLSKRASSGSLHQFSLLLTQQRHHDSFIHDTVYNRTCQFLI